MNVAEAKRRARAGPAFLLLRRGFALVVTFVSTVTISRLLSPADYGLASLSIVLLAFAEIFRDFGLTNALLRKGEISQAEMSFIFWFNVATTTGLTILLASGTPLVARFYREPVLIHTVLVSLIGFWASGIAAQHRLLVSRELRFGAMASIDSVALLIGFATSLALALAWRNVWAIVIGGVTQTVTAALLYAATSRWRPDRPARPEGLRELLRFGADTSIYSIAIFVAGNAAPIILGRMLGSADLGQYNRAQALFAMPSVNVVQPIAQTSLPLMARLRPHPAEYRLAYLALLRKLCTFLMPVSVALAAAAVPLVRALLGPGWDDAGTVLAALSPALAAVGLGYAAGDLFVTQNRSGELRTLGLIDMTVRISLILIGTRHGLIGAALGFTAASITMAFWRLLVAGRSGPVTIADQLRAAAAGLPLAGGAALGSAIGYIGFPETGSAALAAAGRLVPAGVCALAAGLLFASSRRALNELASALLPGRFPCPAGSRPS